MDNKTAKLTIAQMEQLVSLCKTGHEVLIDNGIVDLPTKQVWKGADNVFRYATLNIPCGELADHTKDEITVYKVIKDWTPNNSLW